MIATCTLSAASSPRATARPPTRTTIAPASRRFSATVAGRAEVEAAIRQVAQEGRVLIEHSGDPEGVAGVQAAERPAAGRLKRAVGPGDRVAVRVDRRVAEEGVDPVDQVLRDGVLHVLGLLVDRVPGHLQGLRQEEFQQPMPTEDPKRQLLPLPREPDPLIRRVRRQFPLRERLEHPRHGAGGDAHCLGELSGGDSPVPALSRGDLVDRLDVVLDGQARHHRRPSALTGTSATFRTVPVRHHSRWPGHRRPGCPVRSPRDSPRASAADRRGSSRRP